MSSELITTADMLEDGTISGVWVDSDGNPYWDYDPVLIDERYPQLFDAIDQDALRDLWVENPSLVHRRVVDGEARYVPTPQGVEFIYAAGLTDDEPHGTME